MMLDREFVPPPCKIIFTEGRFTELAEEHHKRIPLEREYPAEPPKRDVVGVLRRRGPLRRERPTVIPREVPEKRLAPKPAPKVEAPRIKGRLAAIVNRWLLPSGYRWCACGSHAVPTAKYNYKRQRCKHCEAQRKIEWNAANSEHVAEYFRTHRKLNNARQKITREAWRARNPEWVKAATARAYAKVRADPEKWEKKKQQARDYTARQTKARNGTPN